MYGKVKKSWKKIEKLTIFQFQFETWNKLINFKAIAPFIYQNNKENLKKMKICLWLGKKIILANGGLLSRKLGLLQIRNPKQGEEIKVEIIFTKGCLLLLLIMWERETLALCREDH